MTLTPVEDPSNVLALSLREWLDSRAGWCTLTKAFDVRYRGPGDGNPPPLVVAHGEIDGGINSIGNPVNLFQPSLAVNANHDIAIAMHRTSVGENVDIVAWGRTVGGDETDLTLIKDGENDTIPGFGDEWGDYTGAGVDPDGERFWVTGQYMKNGQSNFWATRIARIRLLPP